MRRILTLTLAVHWMCVFAMLAVVCAVEPRDGVAAPLRLLGLDTAGMAQDGGSKAAAFFAVAFLLAAVLFLVGSSDVALGRQAPSRRRSDFAPAFGAGALVLTLLLLAAAPEPVPNLFSTLETVLAAALASYLAIRAEPSPRAGYTETADAASVARLMALGAAHASLLARFSGRPAGEDRPRNP